VVLEPEAYERWLAGGQDDRPPAVAGAELFVSTGCNTCHVEPGGGRGPSLRGIFGSEVELAGGQRVLADATYLRRSILDPSAQVVAGFQPIMPTYRGQISEENLFRLIAYIRSLSAGRADGAAPTTAAPPAAGAAAATAEQPAPAGSPATTGSAEGTR
jgi:cytochrome c oxidase subunit 2